MDCDDMSMSGAEPKPGPLSATTGQYIIPPSPMMKTRSLSDGGNSTPGRSGRLSPSPFLLNGGVSGAGPARSGSKDDSSITSTSLDAAPVTPRRATPFPFQQARGGLSAFQPADAMQISQTPQKDQQQQPPSTPVSSGGRFLLHQQLQQQQLQQQQQQQQQQHLYNNSSYISKPTPLSPKLDPSQIYASPTNILPRRSRGLDFSRAATSLHHSTLAEQTSPDSSPIHLNGSNNNNNSSGSGAIGAMNIPGRKSGDYGGATESSTSLWSMMGRSHESNGKPAAANAATAYYPSSSMGSVNTNPHLGGTACSDSSSSSEEDDFMDEDTDEPFITTPQVGKTVSTGMNSPAMNSLLSFTHRQRPRKQSKRLVKGPLGIGFSSISATSMGGAGPSSSATAGAGIGGSLSNYSKSPPTGSGFLLGRDAQNAHSRRESISWAANQLHISGSESDDNPKNQMDVGDALGQRGVIRRQVTRRGNLLPKTKGFARIRAALAEESAPGDADFRRESEVVRQVLESDMDPVELLNHQNRLPPPANTNINLANLNTGLTAPAALNSVAVAGNAGISAIASPRLLDNLDDPDDDMAMDALSGFGKPRIGPSAGTNRLFWNKPNSSAQPSSGSLARAGATTPPPQPRTYSLSSVNMADDTTMDSPGGSGSGNGSVSSGLVFPSGGIFPMTTASSSGGGTPQPGQGPAQTQGRSLTQIGPQTQSQAAQSAAGSTTTAINQFSGQLPSAAEITRRIQSKRRRDDDSDLDSLSFKRRAVSPSISVHNSPIMQSPLQRDVLSWGGGGNAMNVSRPGSVSGGVGSIGLFELAPGSTSGGPNGGNGNTGNAGRNKGRIGYQTMVDANDSITRLSIE